MTLHANLYCLNTCAVQRFEMHDVCPISYFNQAILTNFLASRRLFPFRPQELATVFRLKQPRINIRVNQGPVHRWELCWVVWIPFAWLNKQTSSGLDDISLYFHFIAARILSFRVTLLVSYQACTSTISISRLASSVVLSCQICAIHSVSDLSKVQCLIFSWLAHIADDETTIHAGRTNKGNYGNSP